MDKSTITYNIRGCIRHADCDGAMKWILRASSSLVDAEFVELCDSVLADLREKTNGDSALLNVAISILNLVKKLEPENDASRRRYFDQNLDADLRKEELRLEVQRAEERLRREQERSECRRLEVEIQKKKQFEFEQNQRLHKLQKRKAQLQSAQKFLRWAGYDSESLSEEQMLTISEELVPRTLSRKQHRQAIIKLGLNIDDDHFLTNSYRHLYRRVTYCYRCKNRLDNSLEQECDECGWIVCDCGACGCGYG